MYAVLIQQLANLHSRLAMNVKQSINQRELRLQRRRERDRVCCQSQPQLNSRAAQSVQEQRQLSLQRRRDGLIAESAQLRESRLLEISACQRERLAIESAEEREASLRVCILQPIVGRGAI